MEAKVDVRKLQMLNDRIIQTLEALTQVRASVHGIGQTGPYGAYPPVMQGPWAQPGLGHSPAMTPYAPYASPYASLYGNTFGPSPIGLSHSSYAQSAFVPSPWFPQVPAYAYAQPHAAQWALSPLGLSHTGIDEVERRIAEQRASDIGRLMQTFPYGAYV